jgi:hypothetical protein
MREQLAHLSAEAERRETIAQYTQMYRNNRTALAEDNTATP